MKNWVLKEYNIPETTQIIRPFWPGSDYKNTTYPDGCMVIDNPPFSILAEIKKFYTERNIKFFLWAPQLTIFSSLRENGKICYLIIDTGIVYENDAIVKTGFCTNLDTRGLIARSCPSLDKVVKEAVKEYRSKESKVMPKYTYPESVLTSSMLSRMCKNGVEFSVKYDECKFIRSLDSQKPQKKTIYGGGLLLGTQATRRKAQAQSQAQAQGYVWGLSEKELNIIREIDGNCIV